MDVATISFTILAGLAVCQIYDMCPMLARWLITTAASRLDEGDRERYREEWMAHLAECYGKLGMIGHGLGCWRASLAFKWPQPTIAVYLVCFGVEKAGFIYLRLEAWRIERNTRALKSDDTSVDENQLRSDLEKWIGLVGVIHRLQAVRRELFRRPDKA